MIEKLGVQIYTVRDYLNTEEDVKRSFEKLGKMGYREIQTAGLYSFMSPESFKKAASDNGLEIIGTHIDFNEYETNLDNMVNLHNIYGTKNMGIGGAPDIFRERPTKEYVSSVIERMRKGVTEINKKGFTFTYHHHDLEFIKVDKKTMMDYLIEAFNDLNATFVIDTYWLQAGGVAILEYIEKLKGKADILHLKDYEVNHRAPSTYAEIMEGNINWYDVIRKGEECGIKHYIVEQDICKEDPFKSLEISINNLKNAGLLK